MTNLRLFLLVIVFGAIGFFGNSTKLDPKGLVTFLLLGFLTGILTVFYFARKGRLWDLANYNIKAIDWIKNNERIVIACLLGYIAGKIIAFFVFIV